jgi:hypothetical protein
LQDTVTGFTGVVTSVCFDLYGCVQGAVTPAFNKKTGKHGESFWYDTKRLKVLGEKPVMPVPTFDVVPGGFDKPAFSQHPSK